MNQLTCRDIQTKYSAGPHLMLIIDDIPIDVFLAQFCQQPTIVGLVPALLDWIVLPAERAFTWQRIAPPPGTTTIAPLLMCPDDAEFFCAVVVTEITVTADVVHWQRFGMANGEAYPATMPDSRFDDIRWFTTNGPLTFAQEQYAVCLAQFRALHEGVDVSSDGS